MLHKLYKKQVEAWKERLKSYPQIDNNLVNMDLQKDLTCDILKI